MLQMIDTGPNLSKAVKGYQKMIVGGPIITVTNNYYHFKCLM